VRYVELNPVRAGFVKIAHHYEWSSAQAHARIADDGLLCSMRPFPGWVGDWPAWLDTGLSDDELLTIRKNTRRGAPTGSEPFVQNLEARLGRRLHSLRRGPRPKT
jgi:putative transposase